MVKPMMLSDKTFWHINLKFLIARGISNCLGKASIILQHAQLILPQPLVVLTLVDFITSLHHPQ